MGSLLGAPRETVRSPRLLDGLSLCIWIVAGVGATLRWYRIAAESLWLDEAVSYANVALRHDSSLDLVLTRPLVEPHPPLYYLLLDWWTEAFGTTEVALRSMSAVLGVVTILLVYRLTVKLFGDRTIALVASVLVAVSSMHVYFAQEARMYTLMTALTATSFYWYVDVVFAEEPSPSRESGYVIATVLLGYTHTFAVFVILAQNVYVAVHTWRHRPDGFRDAGIVDRWTRTALVWRWVRLQVAVGVLLAPWLVVLVAHTLGVPVVEQGDTAWITVEPLGYLLGTFSQYFFYALPNPPVIVPLVLVSVGAVLPVLAVLRLASHRAGAEPAGTGTGHRSSATGVSGCGVPALSPSDRSLMLATWLLVPTVVPFVLSHLLEPLYRHKYTIAASLALFVLVAREIVKARDDYGPWVGYGLAVLVVTGTAAGLPATYDTRQKADWRGAVEGIEANAPTDDPHVLATPKYVNITVEYYADEGTTVSGIWPDATWNGNLSRATDRKGVVWLAVSTWRTNRSEYASLTRELRTGGYEADVATDRRYEPGVRVVAFRRTNETGQNNVSGVRTPELS